MGTVATLDWARTLPGFQRFIYVSSGAVYKHHGPDRPGEPLPEDGYVMPRRLYGISKLASELITERYGDLFGLSTASVRPSSVYGTMDRVTATPQQPSHSQPHRPSGAGGSEARAREHARCGRRLHPCGRCGRRHHRLLRAPRLRYSAYNVAAGVTATAGDLISWAAEKVPGFGAEVVPSEQADIVRIRRSTAACGAPTMSRALRNETGWRPRPVREALHAYMDWLVAERAAGQ